MIFLLKLNLLVIIVITETLEIFATKRIQYNTVWWMHSKNCWTTLYKKNIIFLHTFHIKCKKDRILLFCLQIFFYVKLQ